MEKSILVTQYAELLVWKLPNTITILDLINHTSDPDTRRSTMASIHCFHKFHSVHSPVIKPKMVRSVGATWLHWQQFVYQEVPGDS